MTSIDTFFGILVTLLVLTIVIPPLRFYVARNRLKNRFTWSSDFFFAFAVVIAIHNPLKLCVRYQAEKRFEEKGFTGLLIYLALLTQGESKYLFALGLLYIIELWALKAAFLLFYYNLYIATRITGFKKSVLYFATFYFPASFGAALGIYLGWCQPISENWPKFGIPMCSPDVSEVVQIVIAIMNITSDLLLLALPLLILREFELTRVDKYALTFVFTMGLLSIIATLIRISLLLKSGTLGGNFQINPLEGLHWIEVLSTAEVLAAIIAFSLPSFRFLLRLGGRNIWSKWSKSWSSASRRLPQQSATFRQNGVGQQQALESMEDMYPLTDVAVHSRDPEAVSREPG